MPVLFDASGNALPETEEQWRAAALLDWLKDERVAKVLMRRGHATFHHLVMFAGKLQDSMVEWNTDPTTGDRTNRKRGEDGAFIPRKLSVTEIARVRKTMLDLLKDSVVRHAIAQHDARIEQKRRAAEYLADDTGIVSPPPKFKVLCQKVRQTLQEWRVELEHAAESEKLVVRPY